MNDNTDDDGNSATMESNLNSSLDDNNISPPADEVMMEEIRDEDRSAAQDEMMTIDRPVGDSGVHDIPTRRFRSRNMRIARKCHQRSDMNAVQDERKRFKCSHPNCTSTFTFEWIMKRHMRAVHSGKSFECTICSKKFKYKCSITPHMANIHGQGLRYCCYLCHVPRADKWKLKRHMNLLHTGRSLFHCSLCGRGFGANWDLQRHMNIHRC